MSKIMTKSYPEVDKALQGIQHILTMLYIQGKIDGNEEATSDTKKAT